MIALPTPTNPGLLVGETFTAVALGTLIWAKVTHWALAAVRNVRGGD